MLIYFKLVVFINISLELVTLFILKEDISSIIKEAHLENIKLISSTNDVSKFDKKRFFKLEQPENIEFILVTCDVLN